MPDDILTDLTQIQRDNLLTLFNSMETRIQTNFYT